MVGGFDDMLRKLEDLQHRLEAIQGQHSLSESEMFPPAFMKANTQFTSMKDLIAASGFAVPPALPSAIPGIPPAH
jgi:hypothetical protein